MKNSLIRTGLRRQVRCPHCWGQFGPEDSKWITAGSELVGDIRLGSDQQKRFLPTRFDPEGNAIDSSGTPCQEIACPHCHLQIPRSVLEMRPFFVSIAGTPSCGKSYYLASMIWQLRKTMPRYFCIDFGDADPVSNQLVNEYEKQQFFNSEQDKIVKLAKTEEQGDLYSVVQYEDHTVSYPRPFLFFAKTGQNHPGVKNQGDSSRLICLYDNAGESFQPGKDTVGNKVTRHLGVSNCVMYCFDPTQDPRMRSACGDATDDFQVASAPVTNRQDIVLHEIASRIKKHGGLKESERSTKPLLVICTKFDAWSSLMGEKTLPLPFVPSSSSEIHRLDLSVIRDVSKRVRNVLYEHSPEIVGAAESFSSNVYYIPVSATGRAPEQDEETGLIGVRPRDIKPMWCEVPMLLAIACWSGGLVPYIESNKS